MKKQIVYSKFIPRIFAMTIDLIILSIVLTPLMNLISHYVFLYFFNDFFVTYGVDSSNREAFSTAVRMQSLQVISQPVDSFHIQAYYFCSTLSSWRFILLPAGENLAPPQAKCSCE